MQRLDEVKPRGFVLLEVDQHLSQPHANRLGHTSVRMLDTTYVRVYADVAREVADAIDKAELRTNRGLSADS